MTWQCSRKSAYVYTKQTSEKFKVIKRVEYVIGLNALL